MIPDARSSPFEPSVLTHRPVEVNHHSVPSGYEVDESAFPLLVVRFVGPMTDADFQGYLDHMENLRSRARNAAVFDATEAGHLPARQRRMQAEWLKTHRSMLQRYSVGSAFVMPSPIVRGALTAILWITDMPGPHTVVESRELAEAWAREQLRAAGLEPR